MKWIEHQLATDSDLERKVGESFSEILIEQKRAAHPTELTVEMDYEVRSAGPAHNNRTHDRFRRMR